MTHGSHICGEQSRTYRKVESLSYTLETNITCVLTILRKLKKYIFYVCVCGGGCGCMCFSQKVLYGNQIHFKFLEIIG